MKLLSLDPGAERMGWAIVDGEFVGEDEPVWIDSGIWQFHRGDQDFQPYKLDLIKYVTGRMYTILSWHSDLVEVVSEIVPAVGGGNFVAATQSHLAHTAATAAQTYALTRRLTIAQIGATTVKKQIGGSGKATKVKVRNGVYHFFPFLKDSRGELWKKIHDESDAVAIALAHFGYQIPKL